MVGPGRSALQAAKRVLQVLLPADFSETSSLDRRWTSPRILQMMGGNYSVFVVRVWFASAAPLRPLSTSTRGSPLMFARDWQPRVWNRASRPVRRAAWQPRARRLSLERLEAREVMATLQPLSSVPDADVALSSQVPLASEQIAAKDAVSSPADVSALAAGQLATTVAAAGQQNALSQELVPDDALAAARAVADVGNTDLSTAASDLKAAVVTPVDTRVIASIYQLGLRRNSDATGLSYWNAQLAGNMDRRQVALAIFDSNEFRAGAIADAYQVLLFRQVDDAGLSYWRNQMAGGKSLQYVVASILASPEFMDSVGTNEDYITAVYLYALNRIPDDASLAYWMGGFNSTFDRATGKVAPGADRFQVAMAILTSVEATNKQVSDLYSSLLKRSADSAGLAYWAGRLRSGERFEEVMAAILGSGEYFAKLQMYLAQNGQTNNANADATNFLRNTGRLSWTWDVSLLPGSAFLPD